MKNNRLNWRRIARLAATAVGMVTLAVPVFGQKLNIEKEKVIQSGRPDGRHVSTRGFLQHLLRDAKPSLAFNPEFTPEELKQWQSQVRAKLRELMNFPKPPPQPAPRKLWSKDREGYVLEKWELYPEPGSVVPYLVLIPNSATPGKPAPAIMCIPGSSGTKENLAGEPPLQPAFKPDGRNHAGWLHAQRNQQAIQFARSRRRLPAFAA